MTSKINPGSHSKSLTNNGFFKLVEPLLQIHPCFFSHSWSYVHFGNQRSLSRCITCHRCLYSTVTCGL